VMNGHATLKVLAVARLGELIVTPSAPKPIEPVMGLAFALGPARAAAQNAAAHRLLIILGERVINNSFELFNFGYIEAMQLPGLVRFSMRYQYAMGRLPAIRCCSIR
jgi:hypothetical protein